MEKSKIFKKILSVSLAWCTLFQTGFTYSAHRTVEPPKALPVSVPIFRAIGGATLITLACATIIEAIDKYNQKLEISMLNSEIESQQRRINRLEKTLRDCPKDDIYPSEEKGVQTELLRGIAKDCFKFYEFSYDDLTRCFIERFDSLKKYHRNKDFKEEDMITILSATIKHASQIKAHQYDEWLKACGFDHQHFKDHEIYNLRYALCGAFGYLRDLQYRNRVSNSLEKNRFLDRLIKILCA